MNFDRLISQNIGGICYETLNFRNCVDGGVSWWHAPLSSAFISPRCGGRCRYLALCDGLREDYDRHNIPGVVERSVAWVFDTIGNVARQYALPMI